MSLFRRRKTQRDPTPRIRHFAAVVTAALAYPLFAGPVAVRAVQVTGEKSGNPLTVPSNLMVDREVSVTARVTGVIDSIQADRGDIVRKGQPLATLDQRDFNLDRRAAEETFNVSQADYQRYLELFKQRLASQAELEQRKARYELARVELEKAILVIDRSVIRAPFDGVVADRFARIGQKVLLEENTPLFRISALEPLLARAYLPERTLDLVRVGEEVSIGASAFPDVRSTGRVIFLSPVVDPASGSFQVMVRVIRDRQRILRPGMAITISFHAKAPKTLLLPSACLIPGSDSKARGSGAVYEVAGGRLRLRPIEFRPGAGDSIQLRSGLLEGAWVVRDPSPRLRDGLPVVIAP